jgi:hypothetical protein
VIAGAYAPTLITGMIIAFACGWVMDDVLGAIGRFVMRRIDRGLAQPHDPNAAYWMAEFQPPPMPARCWLAPKDKGR